MAKLILWCRRCETPTERYTGNNGHLQCKVCSKRQSLARSKSKDFRDKRRARKHGVSLERVREILSSPVCGICSAVKFTLIGPVFDHSHSDGKFRGVLCHGCNAAIGLFGEDPARMLSAIRYLEVASMEGIGGLPE